MRKVEFIKSFATKKKGDTGEYDGMFAGILVRELKVAKFYKKKVKK